MKSKPVEKGARIAQSSHRSRIAFALAVVALGGMIAMFSALIGYDLTNTRGPDWVLIAINYAPMFSILLGVGGFLLASPWQSRRELSAAALAAGAVITAYLAPALANRLFTLIP